MLSKPIKYYKDNHLDYYSNDPFPYWEIDGFFDDDFLGELDSIEHFNEAWDIAMKSGWGVSEFGDDNEIKRGCSNFENANPRYLEVLNSLNSNDMIAFLRHITKIPDLTGDSSFLGGGGHQIRRGGKLGIHVDFTIHDNEKFAGYWRRANILLYLNRNWDEKWGGHLELWDKPRKKGGKLVKKISPTFNKMIIFGTLQESWHGHPEPLNCPEDRNRLSLATYYYSKQPSNDTSKHSTLFAEDDDQMEWYEYELKHPQED